MPGNCKKKKKKNNYSSLESCVYQQRDKEVAPPVAYLEPTSCHCWWGACRGPLQGSHDPRDPEPAVMGVAAAGWVYLPPDKQITAIGGWVGR